MTLSSQLCGLKLFCHINSVVGEQTIGLCNGHWKQCSVVFIQTVCSIHRSSASSSSSSEPEGPWRTSSYHLLVRVFIWIRPCNRSCQINSRHRHAHQHKCENNHHAEIKHMNRQMKKTCFVLLWPCRKIQLMMISVYIWKKLPCSFSSRNKLIWFVTK